MKANLRVLLSVVLFTAAPPVFAGFGEIVASYEAPDELPLALARSSTRLYVYCMNDIEPSGSIYTLIPTTGREINSFSVPPGPLTYAGLTFTGVNNLWIANYMNDCMYRLNARTGSVIDSWPLYGQRVSGIAAEYNQAKGGKSKGLWVTLAIPRELRCYTVTGSVKQAYLWQTQTSDIGWDYRHELLWGRFYEPGPYFVYGFTRTGSLVASFPSPAGSNNPLYGCAFYEGYLWLSASRTQTGYIPYIWQVDVRCLTPVKPASVGRVKALFR
jgi:hypothetical protein